MDKKKQEKIDMNPGGFLAVKKGCTCPVMDNNHGQGIPSDKGLLFWSNGDCPIHDKPKEKK